MRRSLSVSFVLLALLAIAASASAQEVGGQSGKSTSGFSLQPNYPNPFNPETTIPFVLEEGLFASGRPVVLSVRIYNLLRQPIAQPVYDWIGHWRMRNKEAHDRQATGLLRETPSWRENQARDNCTQ